MWGWKERQIDCQSACVRVCEYFNFELNVLATFQS